MRHRFAALLLCCLATLGQAATFEPAIGVTLPDDIAGLAMKHREVFPQKELGVGLAYERDGSPLLATVYIYTGGAPSIPSDLEAPLVRQQFEKVMGELTYWDGKGTVRLGPGGGMPALTAFAGCGPQFITRKFEIDLPDGTLTSATYLTVMKNNFVKLRVSHKKNNPQEAQRANRFVEQLRRLLGACR